MQSNFIAMSASVLGMKPTLGPMQDRMVSIRHQRLSAHRRSLTVAAAAKDENDKKPLAKNRSFGDNLEERIASGEFDDSGSTKEKLTRPVRKLLAKDTLGPGKYEFNDSSLPYLFRDLAKLIGNCRRGVGNALLLQM